MHRSLDEVELPPLFSQNSRDRVVKIVYIALCLQIVAFSTIFHNRYPLAFTETLTHAYIYWILLATSIFSATLLAYYSKSAVGSFVATAVFFFTLDTHQLLYYTVLGGDHSGEIITISKMANFVNIGPDLSSQFGYLSWPNSYIFAFVIHRLYEVENIVTTLDIGYSIYFLLFAVSVWLFAYRIGDGFFAYLSSISYLVVSFTVINKQFVPQFLALILLFFLFYLIDKQGFRWRIVELTLYMSLVFTHPFFPIFYPLALVFRPGISSITKRYRSDSAFKRAYQVFLAPGTLFRRVVSWETWRPKDANIYVRLGGLWLIYFVNNPPLYIGSTFLTPGRQSAGSPLLRILSNILPFVQTSFGGGGGATDVRLLYELAPETLDHVVTWGSRFVILSLFGVLLVSLLFNDISDYLTSKTYEGVDYRGEILVACGGLFVAAELLGTTYGVRVLQVAFLPVALFFYGLRNNTRTVVIVIVCLSLLSPVILANVYVNVALGAGGNMVGYQETQAGQTVGEYYGNEVVVPPHTVAPTGNLSTPRRIDIRSVRDDDFVLPGPRPMVYSERTSYYLDTLRYDCNLDSQTKTIVYDSSVSTVWLDTGDGYIDCIRDEPQ